MRKTIEERINLKTVKTEDGCWYWTAARNAKGYGTIQLNKKQMLAHRVSFATFVEAIRPGNYVLHRCDNPACVNPAHLFQGTQTDNMQDMLAKGRGYKPCGEDHATSKLKAVQVLEILASTGDQRATAKKYGVSKGLVWAIKKGAVWSHVTGLQREADGDNSLSVYQVRKAKLAMNTEAA